MGLADEYRQVLDSQGWTSGLNVGGEEEFVYEVDAASDVTSVAGYDQQWEAEREKYTNHLDWIRRKDNALVKSAQEKLRLNSESGRIRMSLTTDEIVALENMRLQEKQNQKKKKSSTHRLSNGKSKQESSGKTSRSSSGSNTIGVGKSSQRNETRYFSTPSPYTLQQRMNTIVSPSRTSSLDPTMIQQYYSTDRTNERQRNVISNSPYTYNDGRSISTSSLPQNTSTNSAEYTAYTPSYRNTSQPYLPNTSTRRTPIDELHIPSRARAVSSVPYPAHDIHVPRQGRRNVSGPANISFTKSKLVNIASPLDEYPTRVDQLLPGFFPVTESSIVGDLSDADSVIVKGDVESDYDFEDDAVEVVHEHEARAKANHALIERVPVGGRAESSTRKKSKHKHRDRSNRKKGY